MTENISNYEAVKNVKEELDTLKGIQQMIKDDFDAKSIKLEHEINVAEYIISVLSILSEHCIESVDDLYALLERGGE